MKISQKQASLLAKEVVNKIKSQKQQRISEDQLFALKEFKAKYSELLNKKQQVEAELDKHSAELKKIIKTAPKVRAYQSVTEMVEIIEAGNIPTVEQVENEIILSAMFSTEDDLNKFVSSIVSKFSKNKMRKVDQN